jgi:Co/Zn/Cd efflux system component
MSRVSSILRRFARTYLVAVGGGFALVTVLGLVENGKAAFQFADRSDIEYIRGAGIVFLTSVLAVVAGVAISKFRWWALPLTGAIGILVVGASISSFISDPLEPGTFTILVPMVAILVWASLPATWLEFKRQGARTS